jgi:hypothetical protein
MVQTAAGTADSTERRIDVKRRLVVVWALIALPFVGTAAMGGPGGHLGEPHVLFHPIYIIFAIGAILVLLSLRSTTDSQVVRRVALALVVAQAVVVAGMFGEEIAVLQNGGLSAGQEIFEAPLGYTLRTLLLRHVPHLSGFVREPDSPHRPDGLRAPGDAGRPASRSVASHLISQARTIAKPEEMRHGVN